MDANGQRFWLAHGGNAWLALDAAVDKVDADSRRLAIASLSAVHDYGESSLSEAALQKLLDRVPMTADAHGGRAWYHSPATGAVMASHHAYDGNVNEPPREAQELFKVKQRLTAQLLFTAPAVTDIALGVDGLLYRAQEGNIIVRDLHDRFEEAEAKLAGFDAWRLAAAAEGGMWALATDGRIARHTGTPPVRSLTFQTVAADEFVASAKPSLQLSLVPSFIDAGARAVAIAERPSGGIALLCWANNKHAELRVKVADRVVTAQLNGVERPYSVAWLDERRFVVIAPGVTEAVAYLFDDEAFDEGAPSSIALSPHGDFYPMPGHDGGPFLHHVNGVAEYPTGAQPPPSTVRTSRPLLTMALANYATTASAKLRAPLDSGSAGTAWHRLYVEAQIPAETGFTVLACASDDLKETAFAPHHFGSVKRDDRTEPEAAWVPAASELPGHAGFLPHEHARDHAGLFTVLLQRHGMKRRTLRGRYLHLRIVLHGNSRATPCIHSLRAWGPRFSYADRYLPEHYREQTFDEKAEGNATREDFLGRMLANFEGVMTPIEDSIASAWRMTDPRLAPDESLPWLARWVGVSFEPWFPAARRRAWLRCAPELFKRRGTLKGLQLALEILTNGGVSTGRVVVLEEYRMRRTFGTLLGIVMDREYDELLGGPYVSGNSKVGRTLVLTDAIKREVFAVFGVEQRPRDTQAMRAFFASLAHRVTVLVHECASPTEFSLIQHVATREAPAHVVVKARRAKGSFITGLSALLGLDSFVRPPQPPETVTVERSALGSGAVLSPAYSLDPRFT